MHDAQHYRSQAEIARRLADEILDAEAAASLLKLAQDFSEIADDLEKGAVEIRHPERMRQRWRAGWQKKRDAGALSGTRRRRRDFFRGMADDPAELRAKILRYRELLRRVDDPVLREAVEELIRLTNEKLNGHDPAP
jgi:hypothetical protein